MERLKTEIRQEQIKLAVLDIIYKDGLKNLSTRNLAQRIGISEGTIFRHFKSKQGIILSIIKDVQNDFIGNLRKITNSSGEPRERLYKLLCFTVTYLIQNKGITMLLFSEATQKNDEELKRNLQYIFNNQKNFVSKIILDGIALGIWEENTDVNQIAMLYMGIPVALNIELIMGGGVFHHENFCDKMMKLLLKILEK